MSKLRLRINEDGDLQVIQGIKYENVICEESRIHQINCNADCFLFTSHIFKERVIMETCHYQEIMLEKKCFTDLRMKGNYGNPI
jgi:hypothetical protein